MIDKHTITLPREKFRHLVSCLLRQRYIDEMSPAAAALEQRDIDRAYNWAVAQLAASDATAPSGPTEPPTKPTTPAELAASLEAANELLYTYQDANAQVSNENTALQKQVDLLTATLSAERSKSAKLQTELKAMHA